MVSATPLMKTSSNYKFFKMDRYAVFSVSTKGGWVWSGAWSTVTSKYILYNTVIWFNFELYLLSYTALPPVRNLINVRKFSTAKIRIKKVHTTGAVRD